MEFTEQLKQHFSTFGDSILKHLPHVLMMLCFLLVGIALAWVVAKIVPWCARKLKLDVFAEKLRLPKLFYAIGIRTSIDQLLGKLSFGVVILLMIHIASSVLGIPGPAQAIDAVIAFLPQLIAALGIGIAGFLAAEVAHRMLLQAGDKIPGIGSPQVLARGAHVLILVLALSIAAEQVGLEVGLIHSIILLGVAAISLGVAIAFGFGAKDTFHNMIARFYAQRFYRVGDLMHWGDEVGALIAFTPTSVVLRMKDAEIVVPCKTLMEQPVRIHRTQPIKSSEEPSSENEKNKTDS